MTDLLNPDDVRRIKEMCWPNMQRLCRDYLTLWDERDKAVKRVKELEERFITARQIFQRYSVPLDKEIVKMVDRDFWELLDD